MQQVPIAIVALSADQLSRRGLSQSSELVAAVPGLEFNPSAGNGATPFIRGVGATNLSPGFESPVAIYLDDAYVGAPPAGFFSLGSVSSVEVRSEEHTSELQSLMRISYAVFCLKKKKHKEQVEQCHSITTDELHII